MTTVPEIQQAIIGLSKAEYAELFRWLLDRDWEEWDREIEADSAAGKLDFLAVEALEARRQGTLREL